jgi:hypothetical protein
MGVTESGLPYITDVGLASSLQPAGMGVTASGLPYIKDVGLESSLQPAAAGMGITESGLPYITDIGLPSSLQPAAGGGILKTITGGIDTLANVLPKAGALYGAIESLLGEEDQPVMPVAKNPSSPAPASSQPLIIQTGNGQQTGTAQPVFFQTPAPEKNYMLYAGIAILAIIFLRGH